MKYKYTTAKWCWRADCEILIHDGFLCRELILIFAIYPPTQSTIIHDEEKIFYNCYTFLHYICLTHVFYKYGTGKKLLEPPLQVLICSIYFCKRACNIFETT